MENTEETEVERLRRRNKQLHESLRSVSAKNTGLQEACARLKELAARSEWGVVRTHRALNLLREDADRVMRENGVEDLQREMHEWRAKYMSLRGRRAEWMALARRAVTAKAEATTQTTNYAVAVEELTARIGLVEKQRDDAVATAQKVIESQQAQLNRMAEQCRLWKRGELDTMTTIAGIAGELAGHPLPEPGAWERAKAVKAAETLSALRQRDEELARVNDALKDAGISHPQGVQGVRDLANQREGAYEQIDEWKSWEARARGATVQLLDIFGRGGTSLSAMLQAGQYDKVIELLCKEQDIAE